MAEDNEEGFIQNVEGFPIIQEDAQAPLIGTVDNTGAWVYAGDEWCRQRFITEQRRGFTLRINQTARLWHRWQWFVEGTLLKWQNFLRGHLRRMARASVRTQQQKHNKIIYEI